MTPVEAPEVVAKIRELVGRYGSATTDAAATDAAATDDKEGAV
jgi:hypothetical protein